MTTGRWNAITTSGFLSGVVLLTGGHWSPARAWDWGGHIYVGPAYVGDDYYYRSTLPPDAAPPPPQSFSWPTLHEALDQYGWFGRRACRRCPANVSLPPASDMPRVLPPPALEEAPMPTPLPTVPNP